MNNKEEIVSPTKGLIGYFHEIIPTAPDSVLVFQLPRLTRHLTEEYIESARTELKKVLKSNRNYILLGCDVDIHELCGADALALKLKGLI